MEYVMDCRNWTDLASLHLPYLQACSTCKYLAFFPGFGSVSVKKENPNNAPAQGVNGCQESGRKWNQKNPYIQCFMLDNSSKSRKNIKWLPKVLS
jgi:hypothetical protein